MTDLPSQPGDFNEELLSGFLDGELSSEEQALVENAIDQDPQVQQLLDDLQQVRQCLQELPQEQPSKHARQRVLERVRSIPPVQALVAKRSVSTRSLVPWLAAAAAGIALLFVVPPLLQDSSRVAQNSDAPSSRSAPEESAAIDHFSRDHADDMAIPEIAADAAGEETEEFFPSGQIPVVYVTVPADVFKQIPAILAANSIREIDPSVLIQRMRANNLADDPSQQGLTISLDGSGNAGFGGGLASAARAQADQPAESKFADSQRRRDGSEAQLSTMLVEGSPEKIEVAWQQISQYKNAQLVQQAGPQLRGLRYDSNAFRGQLLTGEEASAEKSRPDNLVRKTAPGDSASVGKAGRQPAPEAAGGKELAQKRQTIFDEGKDKKQGSADPGATRKLANESDPIIIQLIIQVSE